MPGGWRIGPEDNDCRAKAKHFMKAARLDMTRAFSPFEYGLRFRNAWRKANHCVRVHYRYMHDLDWGWNP